MALDDVVRTTITGPRIEEAMYRTLRWIDRCVAGKFCSVKIMFDMYITDLVSSRIFSCMFKDCKLCIFVVFFLYSYM